MPLEALLVQFQSSALWTVVAGAAGLGVVAGAVGTFAVLRKRSLQGDMVAHAALPGVAAAALLGGRSSIVLILGGALAGWLAMLAVSSITRRSRVPYDAALGGALSVFFGLGLVLMSYAQRRPGAGRQPLDRYLFGQAAILREADLWVIGGLGGITLLMLAIVWKEIKLLSFDPAFAATLGLPIRRLELLLTSLTVVAVVVGLKAVGVVLMTTLLIAPAAAARQWTNRLGRVVVLAGTFGAVAGAGGTLLSILPREGGLPTGPMIVLVATAIVMVSLAVGSARGLAWTYIRSRRSISGIDTSEQFLPQPLAGSMR